MLDLRTIVYNCSKLGHILPRTVVNKSANCRAVVGSSYHLDANIC